MVLKKFLWLLVHFIINNFFPHIFVCFFPSLLDGGDSNTIYYFKYFNDLDNSIVLIPNHYTLYRFIQILFLFIFYKICYIFYAVYRLKLDSFVRISK